MKFSICPKCQDEVSDEKIYSCEFCGKIMCNKCLEIHNKKHKNKLLKPIEKIKNK